ncbi:glucan biosynthesis protein G [uncultured Mailhella sp.]|uniref:glucan biosynthesis protein G n=1 Tax=uncultured Mailhella sp. TaxID=1981031 RepID=UPI00261D851A|nr:glucan biosynthesis protein G [uncultured Mailhella sp.]
MFQRVFFTAFLLVAFAFSPVGARASAFSFADVQAKAQDLANTAYTTPTPVPEFLTKLTYPEWSSIRCLPEKAIWAGEELPFTVQFFHPGLYYDRTVRIHLVDGETIEDVAFDPALFQYGSEELAKQAADNLPALGFAGFRLHFPLNRPDYQDEAAIFLGASYFRALPVGSRYGIYSRGLALDTATSQGEEFPYFTEFWIVKPAPDATEITVYALMDSPSMAGAYRFIITPGSPTVTQVKNALFIRQGAKNFRKIGLAPLTSMFFYGEEKNGRPDDFRPEVHNSDGLLFTDGSKNWYWSPLANPRRLGVQIFPLNNPRGFGLLQRDTSFDSYQDLDARYDLRPSLWAEPEGDWGPGSLELVEIPTEDAYHDNIVAFWRPDKPRDKNASDKPEDELRYPDTLMYIWKLFWMPPSSSLHEKGQATSTRISRSGDTLTFHVDFAGGELSNLPEDTGISSIVETPEPIPLLEKRLVRNPVTRGWRLEFKVRLPKEEGVLESLMAARKGPVTLRFRAQLKQGENLPDPLTETWIYDWQLQPQ